MLVSDLSLPTVLDGLRVDALVLDAAGLVGIARTTVTRASSQVCGMLSERMHSAYWYPIQDLPWRTGR